LLFAQEVDCLSKCYTRKRHISKVGSSHITPLVAAYSTTTKCSHFLFCIYFHMLLNHRRSAAKICKRFEDIVVLGDKTTARCGRRHESIVAASSTQDDSCSLHKRSIV